MFCRQAQYICAASSLSLRTHTIVGGWYAASVLASLTATRYVLGAFLPLAILLTYTALVLERCMSLTGVIASGLILVEPDSVGYVALQANGSDNPLRL